MENNKTPSIRFNGFTDPWEQRKLLDCIEKITDFRGRTPKKLGMDWSESGYLALSALNVKDGYIDFTQDVHYGNQELYDKWMTGNELHKGQVLFTTEAPMGNVAQVPDNRRYILSQRTIAFGVKEDLITENFLATILRSPNVIATLTALSSGGTAKGVSQKSLSTVEIIIPNDLGEQERLANTFLELDHLITLHQRKYDKLQNIKKSMLKKMFPKNGSNVPEIRFSGFTDPWEQRKLGDVVQITMGQSPDGSTYSDEPSDYILVQGNADLQNGWVCPRIWTTQITKKADAGDLIMSVRAPAGTMGKTAYNAVIGRGVAAIKGNEFIYQLLVKIDMDGFWKTLSCGSTFESLNSENIKNAEVKVPTTAEQVQIGDFFRHLDNLITLHQRELEKLQKIKKSMLEKMFV